MVLLFLASCSRPSTVNNQETIVLLKPDKARGFSLMKALDVRASASEWSNKELSLQDLSDLLWAANGFNRPKEGKRTASSAHNSQDIDVYVFSKDGVYIYNASEHILNLVVTEDIRDLTGKTDAPITIVLISDMSRFKAGYDSFYLSWANIDCGIVSQNISLFCAATGIKTRPRADFTEGARDKIREIIKLKDTQHILLNHPVGYAK
jgi:hypothetical protein